MVGKRGKRIYTVIEINSGSFYGNLSSMVPRVNNKRSVQERLDDLEQYRVKRAKEHGHDINVTRTQFNEDESGAVLEQLDVYVTDETGHVKHECFRVLLDFL